MAIALGDIALVGFAADAAGKSFSFVVLRDLPAGDSFKVTDNGWFAAGGFRANEGIVTYTVPAGGVTAGTVVTIGGLTGQLNPSTGGDQFLAYTGPEATPTFLFAIDFADGNATYAGDATSSNTSAVPTGLTFGTNALAFGTDNGAYAGPLTGTPTEIRANIADETNWSLDDINPVAYPAAFIVDNGGGTTVSINDVSIVEGDAGTSLLTFTVTRSATDGAFAVDFSTTDGTATAPGDYVVNTGTLNFAAGGPATQTISVTINGDTATEAAETFSVVLSNIVNTVGTATLADASGTGTILNDDISLIAINAIQGAGHVSSFVGQTVTTGGIVTAVDSNGFYLQSADADADASIATSEAIFVFTGSAPTVAVGNAIRLTGVVSEFTPGGVSTGNLSTTQLGSISGLTVLSAVNALPTAIILGAAGRAAPTENIDDDGLTSFDPVTDGIDYFESLEAMRVTIPTPLAVSATNGFGEIFTVADGGAGATNINDRGSIVTRGSVGDGLNVTNSGPGSDFNPERIQIDPDSTITPGGLPAVDVGAVLDDVTGVLGYNFGNFEVIPTSAITVATASTLVAETTALVGSDDVLTIASYNVLNLDPNDGDGDTDIADGRFEAIALQLIGNLGSPDIIALQEVQDNSGSTNNGVVSASMTLQMLIDEISANGGPAYTFIDNTFITNNTNGGEPGGNIRVAYLYNAARVSLVAGSVSTTPDAATDFAGSRPPLVATFEFNDENVTVINNHFSSKGGGTPLYGTTQPSINGSAADRLVQAQNVADYVSSLGVGANVVVVGDLNEFDNEESLVPLDAAGLENLGLTLAPLERYSFTFDGNAQSLDQAYVSANLSDAATIDIVHANIEFAAAPGTASDHDPSVIALNLPANAVFTLQLLHLSDGEAGTLAPDTAPFLAALVDRFEDEFANSITLSGGDTFLPGPFLAAGTDPSLIPLINALTGSTISTAPGVTPQPGVVDTVIHNLIGVEASGIGNHEWDLGSNVYLSSIAPGGGFVGAQYASLSANLVLAPVGFPADPLNGRFTQTVGTGSLDNEEASDLRARIAPSVVIREGGETIGLVGATTQVLESISSPTGAEILGFPFGPGANGEVNDMALLAAQLQPVIDDLRAQGVNKIILLSHLQQLTFERQLAPLLRGVDIILAAGSNTRLGDADDVAVNFPGHAADFADTYPIVTTDADGKTTLIVNTDNEYTYLGRLVVDFDANGEIILESITDNVPINGAYASTAANVAEAWGVAEADLQATAFAAGTRGGNVQALTGAVDAIIQAKDGNVYGFSDVYLEGERIQVRNQETNLGNITADANADIARDALGLSGDSTVVSIKNGGGIRAQIGTIVNNPDGTVTKVAPEVGGEVSQLDVENALRFDNKLMVFDTTAQGLLNILNGPTALTPNNGGFIQIGGVRFSYDPTLAVGSRVRDVALINESGQITAIIADDGVVVAGAPAVITAVVLNFTANGGDQYPIKANGSNFRFLLNDGTVSAPVDEALNFTAADVVPVNAIGEQQALAEYFQERYATPETAYDTPDTPQTLDTRIQNIAVRADTVLQGEFLILGTNAGETLTGTAGDETLKGLAGNDTINALAGNDILNGGPGGDRLDGGTGIDTVTFADATGPVSVNISAGIGTFGEANNDRYIGIENITGTDFGDVLTGNRLANIIRGGGGDDIINGLGNPADQLFGDAGNDVFVTSGALAFGSVDGGEGLDTLQAGAANTRIVWGGYVNIEAVSADGFANVGIFGTNGADNIDLTGITLDGIVQVNGGAGNDTIIGSTGADNLIGLNGNDSVNGGAGNDTITGNLGVDTLTGGSGADRFVFLRADSGRTVALADTITDFLGSEGDRIDLSGIDADTTNGSTADAFTFIGNAAFSNTAGELRFESIGGNLFVSADINGDGRVDFAINVNGLPTIAATDFVL